VVVAWATTRDAWSERSSENSVTATVGDATELLVVLVDESARMAGDVSHRSGSDPIGITEPIEAAPGEDSMDRRSRSTQ
jgi:hypothetical protein